MATETKDYQGWKNRATWNVALYLNNDATLYFSAVEFMKSYNGRCPYAKFIESIGIGDDRTPDGFKWISGSLDYKSLNEMMRELVE